MIPPLKVQPGYIVTLFEGDNLDGFYGTFTEGDYDYADYMATGLFNDAVNSIKVEIDVLPVIRYRVELLRTVRDKFQRALMFARGVIGQLEGATALGF